MPQVESLPVNHRVVRFPDGLWAATRSAAKSRDLNAREFINAALDAELEPVVQMLRRGGGRSQLHRIPIDDNALARIKLGRRRTGISAQDLLRICLTRHTAATVAGKR